MNNDTNTNTKAKVDEIKKDTTTPSSTLTTTVGNGGNGNGDGIIAIGDDERQRTITTMQSSIERINVFGNETHHHGWQHVTKDKGIVVTQKKLASSTGLLVRGQGIIHAPPLAILDLIWDTQRKNEYDPLFKTARRLYQLDDHTRIEHHIFNAPPFVSQRDFVVGGQWMINNDGTIIISCKSVQCNACPAVKGYVRGDIVYAGFIIRPQWIEKKGNESNAASSSSSLTATNEPCPLLLPCNASRVECDVTFVAQLELAGSLPRIITKELAIRQPLSLHGIDEYLTRFTSPSASSPYVFTLPPSFYLERINNDGTKSSSSANIVAATS